MAQAKIAVRGKSDASANLAAEDRWAVIGDDGHPFSGREIYLESVDGIDQARAQEMAERIENARAVPRPSLDRFGRFDPGLYKAWEEREPEDAS